MTTFNLNGEFEEEVFDTASRLPIKYVRAEILNTLHPDLRAQIIRDLKASGQPDWFAALRDVSPRYQDSVSDLGIWILLLMKAFNLEFETLEIDIRRALVHPESVPSRLVTLFYSHKVIFLRITS